MEACQLEEGSRNVEQAGNDMLQSGTLISNPILSILSNILILCLLMIILMTEDKLLKNGL